MICKVLMVIFLINLPITSVIKDVVFEQVGHEVTATVYHSDPKQCQGDHTLTASGRRIKKDAYSQRYIAVSRDLLKKYPYGTYVWVEGTPYDGVYIVADTMNKRYKNYIDLLINKGMKQFKISGVKIYKIKYALGVNGA